MIYTVGEMAQKLGVPASTLRYYDKEGLLPFVERSSGGIRMFRENDFEWLQVIRCMKKAGMSIKDIRQYIELAMQGDDTIDIRLEMFQHQREVLTQQIQQLQHTLETVEYKCWFYETAKAAGTIDAPGAMTDADVPERFRAIRQELRGRGFGRAILNCLAKETFCRHGAAELDLIVDADNTQALSLYQKTGFQILEENRCYISQSKIAADGSCMEKETSV